MKDDGQSNNTGKELSASAVKLADLNFIVFSAAGGLTLLLIWLFLALILAHVLPSALWLRAIVSLSFYMLPTIEMLLFRAAKGKLRGCGKQIATIAAVNVLLGWTVIGWVLAFVGASIDARNTWVSGRHPVAYER